MNIHKYKLPLFIILFLTPSFAFAEEALTETSFIFNSLLFIFTGIIAMFAVVGFSMLETGAVKQKNTGLIIFKNSLIFAISGAAFYLVGYNFIYESNNILTIADSFSVTLPEKLGWAADDTASAIGDYSAGYASSSDWFFQMIFATIPALIVAGALGARVKLWPLFIFVAILTGVIYPTVAAWQWGGGFLSEKSFADFAGSTLIYSVGGWCALTGTLLLGARQKRFEKNDALQRVNINFTSLGVFILWISWLSINSGSQLALGSATDAVSISNIVVNTHLSACGGMIFAMLFYWLLSRKINLFLTLSGALGGLVSISAEPLLPSAGQAAFIGAIGGIIVVSATLFLNKMKVDDVSGTIPVFLACGIWGTLIVPLSNTNADVYAQLSGIACVGLFSLIVSAVIWAVMKYTVGIRVEKAADLPSWE